MAEDVHVENNVVVKCNVATNEDYWILLCDKGFHMIQTRIPEWLGPRLAPMKLGHPKCVV
jgi:hypothetical protein